MTREQACRVQWAQEHLTWTYGWKRANPHSPLLALAIDPGLFDRQKKSIILIVSTKFPIRVGRAGWFGVDLRGIKSDLVFILGKATLDSVAYVTAVMEPHLDPLWRRCCEECRWAVVVEDVHQATGGTPRNTES